MASSVLALVLGAPTLGRADDTAPRPLSPTAGYDGGFFVRSADGRSELTIGGLFQVVGWRFATERTPTADVDVKRMRLEFGGKLADSWTFNLEPRFVADGVELEEAWVGCDVWSGRASLRVGRMKVPFGLEEIRSRRYIEFAKFSILNQFSPAEDHGVFLLGTSPSERWEYAVSVSNGTGGRDENGSKDVAGHLLVHPLTTDRATTDLQVGVAATTGRPDGSIAGTTIENEAGLAVAEYAPGTHLTGERTRLGVELAGYWGAWFVQGEGQLIRQELALGARSDAVTYRGGYLTVARTLTGETKTFKGVAPARPFDLATGQGTGAWVVAVRASLLHLDSALRTRALVVDDASPDEIRTLSLGLNWIPDRHLLIRNSLIGTSYDRPVRVGRRALDREWAWATEVQLQF